MEFNWHFIFGFGPEPLIRSAYSGIRACTILYIINFSSLWRAMYLTERVHPSEGMVHGGPYRARTGHLHIANVALYQMS